MHHITIGSLTTCYDHEQTGGFVPWLVPGWTPRVVRSSVSACIPRYKYMTFGLENGGVLRDR